jgi:prepilin-type processing-associated H-X9-DG protein
VQNDEDVRVFEEAYINHVAATDEGRPRFQDDLPHPSNQQRRILRIREGAERFFITDINDPAASAAAQSNIPLLIEWPEHHVDEAGNRGGHVLYMDGHTEFVVYPGKWPMTEETMKILCELAGREPIKKLE